MPRLFLTLGLGAMLERGLLLHSSFFFPMLAVVPYGWSLISELKSGYIKKIFSHEWTVGIISEQSI